MNTHTPGPWHVVMPHPAHAGRAIWIVDAGQEATIAELSNDMRSLVNAPLIAAAPDLLKELKFLHRAYCFAVGFEGRQHQVAIDALTAIEKAEGRQS